MNRRIGIILLLAGLAGVGCHESKSPGPKPLFPEGGTTLFFADCDPFDSSPYDRSEVTLRPDARDVCPAEISFSPGQIARWQSNHFRVGTGTYTEGFRLMLERTPQNAATEATVAVDFVGIAATFTREFTIPAGEVFSTLETAETANSPHPADTLFAVSITIRAIDAAFRLNVNPGQGSFVKTEGERSELCEFRFNLGLGGGTGEPSQAVNFGYENVLGAIATAIVHDFTRGASVAGTLFEFGPQYGIVYVAAESGGCRDTAAFLAPPPSRGFRVDTLGNFTTGDLLSDGQNVWVWELRQASQGTDACREVRILHATGVPLIVHPLASCSEPVTTYFDMAANQFWIILRYASAQDTAWGYTLGGVLEQVEIADEIPAGMLYDGRWLFETYRNAYIRRFELLPFTGGAPMLLDDFPVELTEQFAGRAGLAFPNSIDSNDWMINIFDAAGNWTARYPVRVQENQFLQSISILSSGNRIVYSVGLNSVVQVRALVP